MKKWWLKNKKRILLFATAFMVLFSSLPCGVVHATSIDNGTVMDTNGDGVITLDECSARKVLAYCLTTCGYWLKSGAEQIIEELQVYRDWVALGVSAVVGTVDDSGIVTISDEMWDITREIASAIRGGSGYTEYPGLPGDRFYYYNLLGGNMTGTKLETFMGYDSRWFAPGVAVMYESPWYSFVDPTYVSSTENQFLDYYNDLTQNIILIKEGNFIFPYKVDYENLTFSRYFTAFNTHYKYQVARDTTRMSSDDYRTSSTSGRQSLAKSQYFQGLIGLNCVVFDSTTSAINYLRYDRNCFNGSEFGINPTVSLDVLNQRDWLDINFTYYQMLLEKLQESGDFSIGGSQTIINEFTEEILSSLVFIESEEVEQTSFLKGIYELLKEWLPILGKREEIDDEFDSSVEDFEEDSNEQSGQLGQLVEDSKVEKPDIDSVSTSVDSNIDMDSVGQYGVLLSSVTTNPRVVQLILISLSVSLIAYVFFGKR